MHRSLRGAAVAAVLAALVALFFKSLLLEGLILGDYDAFVYFYPLRQYAAEALREGRLPLWNPYLFLGVPFFANLQTAVLYPPNAVYLWLSTPYAYSASVVGHVFLAGLSMYIFARRSLAVSTLPALVAATTFMFSGFVSAQVGHINQLTVSAWLPLLLAAFDEAVRRRSAALGIATGLIGTLQFLAGHTQEWYFSTVALGLFALWRMVDGGQGSGVRGQRSEVRSQKSEVRGQKLEVGSQGPAVGGQKLEVGGQGPAVGGQKLEVGSQGPAVGGQKLEVGSQGPAVGGQRLEVRGEGTGGGALSICRDGLALVGEAAALPTPGRSNTAPASQDPAPSPRLPALGSQDPALCTLYPVPLTPYPAASTPRPALKTRRLLLIPLAYLALAGLVEAGTAAVQVLPTWELSGQSIRGGGMAYGEVVSFSLPPTTALYTLLPTYPAELFSEFVGYVGVVALMLAALAVLAWAVRPVTLFMAALALLGLFLALGRFNPVYSFLYEWVPGMDMFRVPARWLLLYTFAASGLAGLGAQVVLDLGERPPAGRPRDVLTRLGVATIRVVPAATTIAGSAVVLLILFYLADPRPEAETVQVWLALSALSLALAALASLGRRLRWVSLVLLAALVVGELWVAGGKMVFRNPIPYEAYRPERSSTTHILQDAAKRDTAGRMLSFATDQYEVKETPDYKKEYGWLHPDALHQFMVGIKLSEALAANIPLEYGIESVDGYDGGILPLKRYAEFKSLLLPVPGIPADNPLRTNLTYVPPLRILDLLNVRYVLGTKMQDTSVDNVYYDRGISIMLDPGQSARLARMPDLQATSVGVISSTEGARERENGTLAAELVVTDESGASFLLPLRMGMETAETPERDGSNLAPAHARPRLVPAWPPGDPDADYYAKLRLPSRMRVKEVYVRNLLEGATVRIRAITLIDDVAAVSQALVLSDRMERTLFFDMKLYTSRDPLPRAFLVHNSAVRDDGPALETLRQPSTPLSQVVLLAPSPTARTVYRTPSPSFRPDAARLRLYRPEEVVVDVSAEEDGYLVLTDVHYPGWAAEVDGVPVPIERANYLFRAVFVEKGEHTVVFRYDPASFRTGLRITLASLGAVSATLLLLAVGHFRRRRAAVV